MPEEQVNENLREQAEQEILQKQFEERQKNTQEQMEKLWLEAEKMNKTPTQIIIEENGFERAAKIFDQGSIEKFKQDITNLTYASKEEFIQAMLRIVEPFNYARIFNSEIRERAEQMEKMYQPITLEAGNLHASIHPSKYSFLLSDGTEVNKDDDILLEISWPIGEGEKLTAHQNITQVKDSFGKIVEILKENPHIKAVIGVSWMMSKKITDRLGFEKFPDIKISDKLSTDILDMATTARRDKEYDKDVKKEDVMLGAISREQFIERYGK